MKGIIEPDKNLLYNNKFNSICEAPRLSLDIDNSDVLRTYVIANMMNALIVSGQKFSGDDALIQRAISLGDKLLKKLGEC